MGDEKCKDGQDDSTVYDQDLISSLNRAKNVLNRLMKETEGMPAACDPVEPSTPQLSSSASEAQDTSESVPALSLYMTNSSSSSQSHSRSHSSRSHSSRNHKGQNEGPPATDLVIPSCPSPPLLRSSLEEEEEGEEESAHELHLSLDIANQQIHTLQERLERIQLEATSKETALRSQLQKASSKVKDLQLDLGEMAAETRSKDRKSVLQEKQIKDHLVQQQRSSVMIQTLTKQLESMERKQQNYDQGSPQKVLDLELTIQRLRQQIKDQMTMEQEKVEELEHSLKKANENLSECQVTSGERICELETLLEATRKGAKVTDVSSIDQINTLKQQLEESQTLIKSQALELETARKSFQMENGHWTKERIEMQATFETRMKEKDEQLEMIRSENQTKANEWTQQSKVERDTKVMLEKELATLKEQLNDTKQGKEELDKQVKDKQTELNVHIKASSEKEKELRSKIEQIQNESQSVRETLQKIQDEGVESKLRTRIKELTEEVEAAKTETYKREMVLKSELRVSKNAMTGQKEQVENLLSQATFYHEAVKKLTRQMREIKEENDKEKMKTSENAEKLQSEVMRTNMTMQRLTDETMYLHSQLSESKNREETYLNQLRELEEEMDKFKMTTEATETELRSKLSIAKDQIQVRTAQNEELMAIVGMNRYNDKKKGDRVVSLSETISEDESGSYSDIISNGDDDDDDDDDEDEDDEHTLLETETWESYDRSAR